MTRVTEAAKRGPGSIRPDRIAEIVKLYKKEGLKAWIDGDCIHVEK